MGSAASHRSSLWQTLDGGERADGRAPDIVRGDLMEAARLNRYRWVTGALPAGEVLDAGCGLADGSIILSEGGRRQVVAVDYAREVLEAATPLVPASVALQQADVHSLPFESRRFHGAVAFELLENVQDPLRVLSELGRVLRPDGVLAVSVSSGGMVEGRARMRRVSPGSLGVVETLRGRFPHVAVWHECAGTASAILAREEPGQTPELAAFVVQGSARMLPEAASTLLVLASMEPLVEPSPALVLARLVSLEEWSFAWAEQEERLHQAQVRVEELRSRAARVEGLQGRLLEAEQAIGSLPQLQQAIRQLVDEKRRLEQEVRGVRVRLAAIERSRIWRIMAPVRRVTALARRSVAAVERVERLLARMTERGLLERVEGIVERIQRRLS